MPEKTSIPHTGEFKIPTDTDPISHRIMHLAAHENLSDTQQELLNRAAQDYEAQKLVINDAWKDIDRGPIDTGWEQLRKRAPSVVADEATDPALNVDTEKLASFVKSELKLNIIDYGGAWHVTDTIAAGYEGLARKQFAEASNTDIRLLLNKPDRYDRLDEGRLAASENWHASIGDHLDAIESSLNAPKPNRKRSLGARAASLLSGKSQAETPSLTFLLDQLQARITGFTPEEFQSAALRVVMESVSEEIYAIIDKEKSSTVEEIQSGFFNQKLLLGFQTKLERANLLKKPVRNTRTQDRRPAPQQSEQDRLHAEIAQKIDAIFKDDPTASDRKIRAKLAKYHPDLHPEESKAKYTEATQYMNNYILTKR